MDTCMDGAKELYVNVHIRCEDSEYMYEVPHKNLIKTKKAMLWTRSNMAFEGK